MINPRATIVALGGLGFAALLCVISGIVVVSFTSRVVDNRSVIHAIQERSLSWGW